MVEHRCVVCKEEKQTIRVNHSATTGKASVSVNGKSIAVVNGIGLRPLSKAIDSVTIAFTIGVKEKHKVNIRVRGAYWNHFEVYSDSDLVFRS